LGASDIRLDGAFNPAIVNPDWLLSKDLIDEADRDHVRSGDRVLVTSVFSGGRYPWIVVEVTRESLHVSSTEATETPERLREFVVGLLSVLPETPVHGLAVSNSWHAAVGPDRWQTIARTLAPATALDDVAADAELESLERRAGRGDGHLSIIVEPSRHDHYDLFVEVERYWDLGGAPVDERVRAVETLDRHWEETLGSAEQIVGTVLGLG